MLVENYHSNFRSSSEIQRAEKVMSDFFNFQVDLSEPKAVFQADLTKGNLLKKKYRITFQARNVSFVV